MVTLGTFQGHSRLSAGGLGPATYTPASGHPAQLLGAQLLEAKWHQEQWPETDVLSPRVSTDSTEVSTWLLVLGAFEGFPHASRLVPG